MRTVGDPAFVVRGSLLQTGLTPQGSDPIGKIGAKR